jgi:hypothetical protein
MGDLKIADLELIKEGIDVDRGEKDGCESSPKWGRQKTPDDGCSLGGISCSIGIDKSIITNGLSAKADAPFINKGGKSSTGRKTGGLLARICLRLHGMEMVYDRSIG